VLAACSADACSIIQCKPIPVSGLSRDWIEAEASLPAAGG